MYKMDKIYSFHISIEEREAIEKLRKNGINVSRLLRRALRRFADKSELQKKEIIHEIFLIE
jgi:post-segregation antitoxin (ccd killing protein)